MVKDNLNISIDPSENASSTLALLQYKEDETENLHLIKSELNKMVSSTNI